MNIALLAFVGSVVALFGARHFAKHHRRGMIGMTPGSPVARRGTAIKMLTRILAVIQGICLFFHFDAILQGDRTNGALLLFGLAFDYIAIDLIKTGVEDDERPRKNR